MKQLSSAALLLAATLFAPELLAQATNALPTAAAGPVRFDIVSFKKCERIELARKNTDMPAGGDSIARHCQVTAALFDFAYGGGGSTYLLQGEPAWVDTDPYEFLAKVAPQDVPAWQVMSIEARRLMLRDVFANVLHLKLHQETASRPVYHLVVDKGGPKLTPSKPDPDAPPAPVGNMGNMRYRGPDEAVYTGATMKLLATTLAARLDRNVIDMTGLQGTYDFHVKPLPFAHYDPKSSSVEGTDFAAIIDGVRDLGLKLEPAKADTTVFVIDHIERPPED